MQTKPITPAQLKKVQTLFTRLGFSPEDKKDMIYHLSNGRATSTKDISFNEAGYLINYLSGKAEPAREAKRKENREASISVLKSIYRLSYEIGMCYGDTQEDKLMNFAKISRFCRERGTVKKDITQMTLPELQKTKRQFEAMLRNNLSSAVKQLANKSLKTKFVKQ